MADLTLVQQCRALLDQYWRDVCTEQNELPARDYVSDPVLATAVFESVNSKTKTYRYVLPTQLVAKLADPSLDCTCVQAARPGTGAFDARSVAKDVIVPLDQTNDRVLGGSEDPYVSNPLRIAEITAEHRESQKDKRGWDSLCTVLEQVQQSNDSGFVASVFKQVLAAVFRRLSDVKVTYPAPRRISLEATLSLIVDFTRERSGGDRFEAVTTALFQAIGKRFNLFAGVRRSNVTTADQRSGMLADVECVDASGEIVLVVEAKDRELTVTHVSSKIAGIRENKVGEAFFIASKIAPTEMEELRAVVRKEFIGGQNIYTTELVPFSAAVLAVLGEDGRRFFVEYVCRQLDEHSEVKHRKEWARLLGEL